MASSNWTREQQLIALRLYVRTPFGRLHSRNPEIIAIANGIGRSPSAVAMKACNFASLDAAFLATNRRGLAGASRADRALWEEFTVDAERIAAEAELAWTTLEARRPGEPYSTEPTGDTESLAVVRTRRVQSFFRAAVLTAYDDRCAVSGLRITSLLNASHIIPWRDSIERRADPTNGLCLNTLFDRAFDRGLMTIGEDLRVVLSPRLMDAARGADLECSLQEAHGRLVATPSRFRPDPIALKYHREQVFDT